MRMAEYGCFSTPPTYCKQCGACNESTNYKHDPNCILNVCFKDMKLLPYWRHGRNGLHLSPSATSEQTEAHQMGKNIKDKLEPSTHAPEPFSAPFIPLRA
jgi:hypothetical protein